MLEVNVLTGSNMDPEFEQHFQQPFRILPNSTAHTKDYSGYNTGKSRRNVSFLIVCHWVAPRARDASLYSYGIDLKASSEILIIVGRTITVKNNEA